mmetsp:Transcript_27377/g.60549  ORF Transcript_27377/g.60549 Transcript_27377/m.60549 type:complete len:259 (-) Transcript_27377:541-1317(-)
MIAVEVLCQSYDVRLQHSNQPLPVLIGWQIGNQLLHSTGTMHVTSDVHQALLAESEHLLHFRDSELFQQHLHQVVSKRIGHQFSSSRNDLLTDHFKQLRRRVFVRDLPLQVAAPGLVLGLGDNGSRQLSVVNRALATVILLLDNLGDVLGAMQGPSVILLHTQCGRRWRIHMLRRLDVKMMPVINAVHVDGAPRKAQPVSDPCPGFVSLLQRGGKLRHLGRLLSLDCLQVAVLHSHGLLKQVDVMHGLRNGHAKTIPG